MHPYLSHAINIEVVYIEHVGATSFIGVARHRGRVTEGK